MPENLAKVVTNDSIIKALENIIQNKPKLKTSTKFDLVYKGQRFPPKEVIRFAAQIQGIENWETYHLSGGESSSKYLREKGFVIESKPSKIRYFIGGAVFEGDDVTDDFVRGGYWENGYDDRFIEEIKSVPIGSQIGIKSTYAKGKDSYLRIKCIGEVIGNPGDGKKLMVEWEQPFKLFDVSGLGSYRTTFHEVSDPYDIESIFDHEEDENNLTSTNTSSNMDSYSLNTILYGPPGTGKTYTTIEKAIRITNPNFEFKNKNGDPISREEVKKEFNRLKDEKQIGFITFHQSMSYEDFIEGIKPKKSVKDGTLVYDIEPGIFKTISNEAQSDFQFSKVKDKDILEFEEAFDRLKDDWERNREMKFSMITEGYEFTILGFTNTSIPFRNKNGGTSHSLSIQSLKDQYYGKANKYKGGVGYYYPGVLKQLKSYKLDKSSSGNVEKKYKNYVLIIDEINRGNISQIFGELITLIEKDKRFSRKEALSVTLPYSKDDFAVPPNLYIVGTMNTADRSVEALDTALRRRFEFEFIPPNAELIPIKFGDIPLREIFTVINDRISFLLDNDHQIGHYYLMDISDDEDLKMRFKNKIIPLLKEYFYNDHRKIYLVLGKGFLTEIKIRPEFAVKDNEELSKNVYRINEIDKGFNIHTALNQILAQ